MGNCQACLRGDKSKQGNLKSKKGPYALLSADESKARLQEKGKRKAKSKSRQQNIHFNDTFEEGQEDSSPQLDSSEEQLQPTKAGGKWVTLPRVLEELPETATSNRATTAAVENAISEKIPDSSQEAQVQLGNREVCSQEIVPADEEVPAKVIVEFEEYQPQLPPAAQKKLLPLAGRQIAQQLPLPTLPGPLLLQQDIQAQTNPPIPQAPQAAALSGRPNLARPTTRFHLKGSPHAEAEAAEIAEPRKEAEATYSQQGASTDSTPKGVSTEAEVVIAGSATDKVDAGNNEQPLSGEHSSLAATASPTAEATEDEQRPPSTDDCTEEDLAEARALEEQLRAEVKTARSDVFKTLGTLAELQAMFKAQFVHLQEAMDTKTPDGP